MHAHERAPDPALEEIADEARRLGTGRQTRMICPFCSHRRKKVNQRVKVLAVTNEGDRAVFNCHHCGEAGAVRFDRGERHQVRSSTTAQRRDPPEDAPIQRADFDRAPLTRDQLEFLEARGIRRQTADKLGVFAVDKWVREVGEVVPCIAFPYFNQGVAYAAKARACERKGFTALGAPATFWGIERYQPGEDFIIVEGEMDVLASEEAEVTTVSVPSGAPLKVRDGAIDPSEDGKFRYVWAAKKQIDAAKRVILAVDNDSQGEALAEELARRIGKARCWRLRWPDGTKDANDYWLELLARCATREEAAEQFRQHVADHVEPWPVAGLSEAADYFGKVDQLYVEGLPPGESTGWDSVDEFVTIQPGLVYIVTGIPGHGKSSWLDNVLCNIAGSRNWRIALASFENPQEIHISKLCSIHVGKPFGRGPSLRMSRDELEAAKKWVHGHFFFLTQDSVLPTVDSIIERLSTAVMRYGVRAAVIDPWNFVNLGDGGENGTEAVNQALSKLKVFAAGHGIALFLVAHPAKPGPAKTKDWVPTGYDISGSAHFYNRTDFGVTIFRDKEGTRVVVWKVRFAHLGKIGEVRLTYHPPTGRFQEEKEPWDDLDL